MANTNNYLVYTTIDNYTVCVQVSCDTPDEAVTILQTLFKEIEGKVGQIRVADAASGFFIRGYS